MTPDVITRDTKTTLGAAAACILAVAGSTIAISSTKTVNGVTIARTYCKEPDETEDAFGARAATMFAAFCDGYGG